MSRIKVLSFLVLVSLLMPLGASAAIYKDRYGNSYHIELPSLEHNHVREALAPIPNETYLQLAHRISDEKNVDPFVVEGIIAQESGWDPSAKASGSSAKGLMQLINGTARRFNVSDPYDPEQNIRGGVSYYRFLLDYFNGDERRAIAAYNLGEKAIDEYGPIPNPEYVEYVLNYRDKRKYGWYPGKGSQKLVMASARSPRPQKERRLPECIKGYWFDKHGWRRERTLCKPEHKFFTPEEVKMPYSPYLY
ncbi:MAG: lytic transglycosylase domain-containing protein [Candidatus Ryanbacteria bacterium]|nr:lytic transglycosylase domain-containing protein [Candidatus Ryanbacteria bacterium]